MHHPSLALLLEHRSERGTLALQWVGSGLVSLVWMVEPVDLQWYTREGLLPERKTHERRGGADHDRSRQPAIHIFAACLRAEQVLKQSMARPSGDAVAR